MDGPQTLRGCTALSSPASPALGMRAGQGAGVNSAGTGGSGLSHYPPGPSEARDAIVLIKVLTCWRGRDARASKYAVTNYRILVRRL